MPYFLAGLEASSDQWYYYGQTLYHNRSKKGFSDLPSLAKLKTQQRVGIQITRDGSLNLFLDGQFLKTVATGLPVKQAMFGVVDVRGSCTKIKSETLTGELDGPYMQ